MRTRGARALLLVILAAGCLLAAGTIINGTFNGNLNGWSVAGTAMSVGTQGNAVPPSGTTQALVASGQAVGGGASYADVPSATLEADLNLPAGAITAALPNNFNQSLRGSAIWQTFNATAGDVVTFRWNFATNEDIPTRFDAAAYTFRVGNNPAQVFELADTNSAGVVNQPAGAGSPFTAMTGYGTVNIPITTTGTYTIGFLSIQTFADLVTSGTYVSGVAGATDSVAPSVPAVSPRGLAILGILLAASSAFLLRKSFAPHQL